MDKIQKFTIEMSYQPINGQWGALIKHGNGTIFQVDESAIVAVDKALRIFLSPSEILK